MTTPRETLESLEEALKHDAASDGRYTIHVLRHYIKRAHALGRQEGYEAGLKESEEFAEKTIKEVVRNSDEIADAIRSLQSPNSSKE